MTAVTLTHHIAAPLEVIPAELGLSAQNLTQAAKVLDIVDAATFEAGNSILIKAHQTLKDLEAARVKLKKPITELGKAIDGVVANVADPLEVAKRSMQGKVAAWLVANSCAHLVEFKMREIRALHDAGVAVPGLAVERREQTRMAGSRA